MRGFAGATTNLVVSLLVNLIIFSFFSPAPLALARLATRRRLPCQSPLCLFLSPRSLISLLTSPSLPSDFLPLIPRCVSAQKRIHILLRLALTLHRYYVPRYWLH